MASEKSQPQEQNLPAVSMKPLKDLLDRYKNQIAVALPRHLTPERIIRVALTAYSRNPGLQKCTLNSICGAIVQASQLGLECDGVLGHAYLVPFFNKHTGCTEAQLIPGYRGLMDLARRGGQIGDIMPHAVHERDKFDLVFGLEDKLEHRPCLDGDPGKLKLVWAKATFRDGGGCAIEVMTKHEVDEIRKRSKTPDKGPWVDDYEEMAKKTVLRRLCKRLPLSVELATALDLENKSEAAEPQQLDIVPLDDSSAATSTPATPLSGYLPNAELFYKIGETQGFTRTQMDHLVAKQINAGATPEQLLQDMAKEAGYELPSKAEAMRQAKEWKAKLDQEATAPAEPVNPDAEPPEGGATPAATASDHQPTDAELAAQFEKEERQGKGKKNRDY